MSQSKLRETAKKIYKQNFITIAKTKTLTLSLINKYIRLCNKLILGFIYVCSISGKWILSIVKSVCQYTTTEWVTSIIFLSRMEIWNIEKNLYTKVRNPKVNKVILINLIFKICFNGYFHTCTFLHIFSVVQLYIECALR